MLRVVVTFALLVLAVLGLFRPWGKVPALGLVSDPFIGCWQNAESEFPERENLLFKSLSHPVEVVYDEQRTPHIFAESMQDAIFVQGYLHAKNRLWQMDMTTRLASGRLSEVAGSATLPLDRQMRRQGMHFAAKASAKAMMQDSLTGPLLLSYVRGVNERIQELRYADMPLEYKLMSFEPELWNAEKTGLMLKFMADKLSGRTQDFELTLAKQLFPAQFDQLFPSHLKEEYPVVERNGAAFQSNLRTDWIPIHYLQPDSTPSRNNEEVRHPSAIGSNNWALAGSLTKSGKPILCNDPHLPLNLPAIWYENQIHCPGMNVYGVSLPGAPHVVIGFNDSIAWGFTNGYRDVKDFYAVEVDANRSRYFQDGWKAFQWKLDTIFIKDAGYFVDTVAYSDAGILMYDTRFPKEGFEGKSFIMRWMAHAGSNELKALVKLNTATNYLQYVRAISYFECPHQNIVFASASGDIALWSQGRFIERAADEGRFVRQGIAPAWKSIPFEENPHELNPDRGFVMSANQVNTKATYPWYYSGIFSEERAKRLKTVLSSKMGWTVNEMKQLQNDTYHQNAADILPFMLQFLPDQSLTKQERVIKNALRLWDYQAGPNSREAVYFTEWFSCFEHQTYDDNFGQNAPYLEYPNERATMQWMKLDTTFALLDKNSTVKKETLRDILLASFQEMAHFIQRNPTLSWYQYKHTQAIHLARIPAFGSDTLAIGGGHGMVNAASQKDGPSWRMIVHFTQPIEAWGMYHSGQSGNPGSPYYLNKLKDWVAGNYYKIHFMHSPQDRITN